MIEDRRERKEPGPSDSPGVEHGADLGASPEPLDRVGGGEELPADPSCEAAAAEPRDVEESLVPLEPQDLRKALEAVLFSVSEPLAIRTLSEIFGVSVHEVREAVEELRLEYIESGRSFRIEDIAGGVQILTVKECDPWIRRLRRKQREGRLSPAALETLAVIAYKQPINKADLEAIRGVNCGPILKTLLDKGLVKVVGRGEGLGRPLLYGTTRRFLESFGIASVRDLPQPDQEAKPPAEPGTGPLYPPDSGGAAPEPAPVAATEGAAGSEALDGGAVEGGESAPPDTTPPDATVSKGTSPEEPEMA